MNLRKKIYFILLLLVTTSAQARVFDINKEVFAAYFGFTDGLSVVGSSAFKNEAGASVTYSSQVNYNYSGEFGFLVSNPYMSARFGFEVIKPQVLEGLSASNASATLYNMSSEIFGYLPKFGLEFGLRRDNTSRSFFSANGGYGSLTLKNVYSLTAAGTAAYPGMATTLDAKGGAVMFGGSLGHEMLLSDTTTMLFEIGYRYFKVSNLKYSSGGSFFGATYAAGDDVQNTGKAREIDLSGSYIGITFRFYM